ncbi:hypothetical protein A3E39_02870 [Candidatus Uhrbacteria bacterium RIFCSPHIGHO2_12_FULL_60_25]|uniref:Uncharacterized protein n=1 Tax=Candidatus Uhrbacteria bacterium RIFCSPHIGHO2_12_FULL_60_25 TaxID=1802399 RepID=A0A1F7UJG0_9BACT|nr:MAG: hypothetical protein A3D73_01745 [Candidatus Uhrbacteria bacterium RIFCSPHIGHO2_02_FULL_60_44]OGL78416.1 MAG: hypothetical protein A3E39_02870 [Candidatus Uhrbacteria bacterium RIFCSPHIGHO2_12_FULL_60_25]
MRTVYAYDYARAVAKVIDVSTGLHLCGALVQERETELDRDVPLDLRHEMFFRVLADALGSESAERLAASMDARKTSSVASAIIEAACGKTREPAPDASHWESCPYHREWLEQVFAIYLDCLTGRTFEEIAARNHDPAEALMEKLMREISAKGEQAFARWGKTMLHPKNLILLLRAVDGLPEARQYDVVKDIFLAIMNSGRIQEPDEFAILVRRATAPSGGKDMN